ncbi:Uncharacterised protein [Serratia grimesii]|jgi:hypothetical protein|uniref:hypothetical protein n=2 Tax=Serratia grimesii TaxID=82995 RepID=UPI0021C4D196|nr:hypothetical protein [Serratia grimesii]ULG12687.1 hypothetical protein 348p1_00049 [Serratia grimesii]CAI2793759.1 Uncharacterised protein [Serratia grimesii]
MCNDIYSNENQDAFENIAAFERIEIIEGCLDYNYMMRISNYEPRFYVFYLARNKDGGYVKLDLISTQAAIDNGSIKLVDFITDEEYSISYFLSNPDKKKFVASNFFFRKNTNIMEISLGSFVGCRPISIAFTLSSGAIISTQYMFEGGMAKYSFVSTQGLVR